MTHFTITDAISITESYTPKQTLTPFTFAPSQSATPSSGLSLFTSVGMLIFYIVFGLIIIALIAVIIIFKCFRNKNQLAHDEKSGNESSILDEMKKPLADNPDLPDEGTLII